KGADVQTIDTQGIDFPYPGYLENIVRQIALNFSPKGNVGALRAEVFFMIQRNGKVAGFKFLTRSGNLAFDIEAQGAVDAAWRSFGALPAGYPDDVLPVVFSFDPSKLK
ncbi:MAG TPA: TonB C-terminal domain-containing protein, partial [Gemmatimonadaceae bacterium]